MISGYKVVCEAIQPISVPFIIHEHEPRSGSLHFDVRFLDPKNPKILNSFATPSDFLDTVDKKTLLIRTRDHDPRWLKLKSYRLKNIDEGMVEVNIATSKYFELNFHGKVLNGSYRLFKMKNKRRDDLWLLIKKVR